MQILKENWEKNLTEKWDPYGLVICIQFSTYLSYCFDQRIKLGIEGHSPGAVNDASVDMGSEIHFNNVIMLKHSGVTSIWSIMGSTVIDRATYM